MKIKYAVLGLIVLLISGTVWQNIVGQETFEAVWKPIFEALLFILLGLIVYLFAKILFNEAGDLINDVQRSSEHRKFRKEQQASQVEQINQELDEIEASLDAFSSDEKVTPIWELPEKKP